MATYTQADHEAAEMIEQLIDEFHGLLKDTGVRVGALFAFAPKDEITGEPKGDALKKYGLAAVATVRVVSQKDRVAGLPDAQILIDGAAWKNWSEEEQQAVIDRQLQHIEVQLNDDDDGNVKLDDCNRPKLRLLPPDYLISGFRVIAERHGEASVEIQEAKKLEKVYGQLLFDFEPVGG